MKKLIIHTKLQAQPVCYCVRSEIFLNYLIISSA